MEMTETELSSGRGLHLPNIPSTEGSPSAASARPGEPEGPLIPGRDSRREQDSHHFWCWRWVSPTGGGASERVGQEDGAPPSALGLLAMVLQLFAKTFWMQEGNSLPRFPSQPWCPWILAAGWGCSEGLDFPTC